MTIMRPWMLGLALLVSAAACSRESVGPAGPEKTYRSAGASFRMPGAWRVLERQGGAHVASFFGPIDGKAPFSASISVYRYPAGSEYATAVDYASAHGQQAASASAAGRAALSAQGRRLLPSKHGMPPQEIIEDSLLIEADDGLLVVVHSAPAGTSAATDPVYRRLLETLKL